MRVVAPMCYQEKLLITALACALIQAHFDAQIPTVLRSTYIMPPSAIAGRSLASRNARSL